MRTRWAVLAALLTAISLQAQTTFTLQEEDDSLVSESVRGDRGYTNGTRILWSWIPGSGSQSVWRRSFAATM
jgi:hypothetical protein